MKPIQFSIAVFCLMVLAFKAESASVSITVATSDQSILDAIQTASLSNTVSDQPNKTTQDVLGAARADYTRLIGALYALGYYSGVISIKVDGVEAAEIAPVRTPKRITQINIRVNPGPRFSFGRARVAPLPKTTEMPNGFSTGEPAISTLISDAVKAGAESWRADGHAKVTVENQSITADHDQRQLNVDVRLNPGPKLTFGDLLTKGDSRVRPARIRAIGGLLNGQTYSPEELKRVETRLRRVGAFRSVNLVEAKQVNTDGSLDITAEVVDEKRRRLGFGAEISSLEGLGVSALWMHRNLMGGAERLRVEAEAGGIGGESGGQDLRFSARLDRPATFSPDTGAFALAKLQELDEPDYFERVAELGFGIAHLFSDKVMIEAGLTYRYTDVEDDISDRSFEHLFFPLSYTRDFRDAALDAKGGYYLNAQFAPFLGLSGSEDGARVLVEARFYRQLGRGAGPVFAVRGQLGSVLNTDAEQVPPDLLFFSGGGGTVRGQPYQSLAIERANGDRLGGRSFLGISAELRIDVSDTIGVVGFYDTGFIGAGSTPGSDGEWHSGAGVGLRYNTGIGPLRLDVAVPVDGSTGDGLQIYVGIGQAF